jgi:hypothetical protein
MSKAYIISQGGIPLAVCTTNLKNGEKILWSYQTVTEKINANRELNLVNARHGKISRSKKWKKFEFDLYSADEINNGEFFVY